MKGVATVWIQILVGIFAIGLLYVVFSWVLYGNITPAIYPQLEAINGTTSGVNTTMMFNTINIINVVWQLWPLIFIGGLIVYGFARGQKKEYEVGF